ncbi:MAG: prepilin-type N-terminal cleavage/methylation domain-containing protein [Nitrospirota bacterium]
MKIYKKSTLRKLNSEAGFTLLEMIAAMTILSIVTVIIAYGFYLGIDAWKRGEKETDWTQKMRVLSGLFHQQIKSAYPYEINIDDEKAVIFKGTSDSIMFVTALTDASVGGFKWVRYSFQNGTLMYNEGILPDKELDENSGGKEQIVDTDLEKVEFSYYSSDEQEWEESWDFGEFLPGAVKISITYFPPFTVSIPMGLRENENNKNEEAS